MIKPTFDVVVPSPDHIGKALEKLKTAFSRSFPDKKLEGSRAQVDITSWRTSIFSKALDFDGDIAARRAGVVAVIEESTETVLEKVKKFPMRLGISIAAEA